MVYIMSLPTSSEPPGKAYYTEGMDMCMLRPTLMQDMQEIKPTVSLMVDMPLMLGEILSLEDHKNNLLFHRAMADMTSEMLWLRSLLIEIGFPHPSPMKMYCDNEAATFIASNEIFHMRTKHIEIDCHLIRQYVLDGTICTPHVASAHHLADIFTKALAGRVYETIGGKLGMFDLHALA